MSIEILLIEDDPDDALFFSDALDEVRADARLEHCIDANLALDKLAREQIKPDIIFLDVNMPAINGWDCLREIKTIAQWKHTPIVMYSNADLYNSGVTPADVGAAAFYQKSDSFDDLKKKVADILSILLQLK